MLKDVLEASNPATIAISTRKAMESDDEEQGD